MYCYVQTKQASVHAELSSGSASENEIIECLSPAFFFLSQAWAIAYCQALDVLLIV